MITLQREKPVLQVKGIAMSFLSVVIGKTLWQKMDQVMLLWINTSFWENVDGIIELCSPDAWHYCFNWVVGITIGDGLVSSAFLWNHLVCRQFVTKLTHFQECEYKVFWYTGKKKKNKLCNSTISCLKAHVRPRCIARRGIVFICENLAILQVRVI